MFGDVLCMFLASFVANDAVTRSETTALEREHVTHFTSKSLASLPRNLTGLFGVARNDPVPVAPAT